MTLIGYTMMCEQVSGDPQEGFITWAATELLPALRAS